MDFIGRLRGDLGKILNFKKGEIIHLILDNHKSHRGDEVKELAVELNI